MWLVSKVNGLLWVIIFSIIASQIQKTEPQLNSQISTILLRVVLAFCRPPNLLRTSPKIFCIATELDHKDNILYSLSRLSWLNKFVVGVPR